MELRLAAASHDHDDGAIQPDDALGDAPAKRPRGRPKGDLTPTPCVDSFGTIAAAIAGIPDKVWPAAKEGVQLRAARDRRLVLSDRDVLTYLLAAIGRRDGQVPHTIATIARGVGYPERTVLRAIKRLVDYGYALRDVERHAGARWVNKRGLTTLPALFQAANEERARRERRAGMIVTQNANDAGDDGDTKIPEARDDGDTKMHSPRTPYKDTPCSSNTERNHTGACAPAPATPARISINEVRLGCSPAQTQTSAGHAPPRYDRTLPLASRLWVPASYDSDPEAAALRRRMVRAGGGRDPTELKWSYCDHFDSKATHDAQEGFISWLGKLGPLR